MKNFRQLVKELPSSTVVVTTGSFNPPTAKHELQFKLVEKLVDKHNAAHVIYIKEEGLPTSRKTHFLNLMFKPFNYAPLKGSLNEEVAKLKTKYRNVIVVGDSVKGKLAESVQVIPFDDVDAKIKGMVTKGDYTSFKQLMPSSMRDIDAKRLMNEMRQSYGLEFLKEDVKFSIDTLRDKYFKGEIYQIGDIVESAGQEYEIMDRGSNYLVVVNNTGDLSRKWVKDVNLVEAKSKQLAKACWKGYKAIGLKNKNGKQVPNCVPEEVQEAVDPKQFCYKGYTTKNFHHCADTAKAFELSSKDVKDPVGMLKAVKTTDAYMELHGQTGDNPTLDQIKSWKGAHIQAKDTLVKLGKFDAHQETWTKHGEALTKMLEPHAEKLKEELELGKHSNDNIGKSVMTYQNFMKANKLNPGFIKDPKQHPFNHRIEPNVSQQIDDLQDWPFHPQTAVGHTLATRPHLRRQKVMYVMEEVDEKDTITFDIPLLIRVLEMTREDVKSDAALHKVVEKLIAIRDRGTLTMSDYKMIAQLKEEFLPEANSGEVGDEAGDDKIAHVKTLPPQLAPKKKDADRLGGGTRDHTFSAFMEKQKKENVDFDFTDLVKRRLAKENK